LQCALRLAAMLPDTLLPSAAEDRRAPEPGQHRRPRQGHAAS
jgi:hypothetical protein